MSGGEIHAHPALESFGHSGRGRPMAPSVSLLGIFLALAGVAPFEAQDAVLRGDLGEEAAPSRAHAQDVVAGVAFSRTVQ